MGWFFLERDHAGGNEKIKQLVPGIKVYGGSLDKVKGCTDAVDNGDKLSLGQNVNILALHTPWYVPFYVYIYASNLPLILLTWSFSRYC